MSTKKLHKNKLPILDSLYNAILTPWAALYGVHHAGSIGTLRNKEKARQRFTNGLVKHDPI